MEDDVIKVFERLDFLEFRYSGSTEEAAMFRLADFIVRESRHRNSLKILIDLIDAVGNPPSSTRFKLGFFLAENFGSEFRLGVVADGRANMIAKNVAVMRGVNIFVHHERSSVEEWLSQPE